MKTTLLVLLLIAGSVAALSAEPEARAEAETGSKAEAEAETGTKAEAEAEAGDITGDDGDDGDYEEYEDYDYEYEEDAPPCRSEPPPATGGGASNATKAVPTNWTEVLGDPSSDTCKKETVELLEGGHQFHGFGHIRIGGNLFKQNGHSGFVPGRPLGKDSTAGYYGAGEPPIEPDKPTQIFPMPMPPGSHEFAEANYDGQKKAMKKTIALFRDNQEHEPDHMFVCLAQHRKKSIANVIHGLKKIMKNPFEPCAEVTLYSHDECGFHARLKNEEEGEEDKVRYRCKQVSVLDRFLQVQEPGLVSSHPISFDELVNGDGDEDNDSYSVKIESDSDVEMYDRDDIADILQDMNYMLVEVPIIEPKRAFVPLACRKKITKAPCSRSKQILKSFTDYCVEQGNERCKCLICSARKTFANNGISIDENPFTTMLKDIGEDALPTCKESFDFKIKFGMAAEDSKDEGAVCTEKVMQQCTLSTPTYEDITKAVGKTEKDNVDLFDAYHSMLNVDKMPKAFLSLSEPKSWTFIVNQWVSKMKNMKMDQSMYEVATQDFCISHQHSAEAEGTGAETAGAEAGAEAESKPETESEAIPEKEGGRRRLAMAEMRKRRRRRGGARS